ncbi:MAG: FG-GAP repeat protein [Planctomycetes bacterium]|nr:FG-GAP repeat protein [Planctomycetota bacterium]
MNPSIVLTSSVLSVAVLALSAHGGDFNGDGFDDLAIGVTLTGGPAPVGAIQVLYANAGGLSSNGMQTLTETTTPIVGDPNGVDFGLAMAIGDFDADGFDDLAVSAPFAKFKTIADAGAVSLFRGTPTGLVAAGLLHQNQKGMKDKCEEFDYFGFSLAAGDFDGNGFDDLAIGVLENVAKAPAAGAVQVVYGSKKGLNAKKDQVWSQASKGIESDPAVEELFGTVLAAGDADGDGFADLAIGVPFEVTVHGTTEVTGAVALLRGSKKGLTSKNDALFDNADLNSTNFDPTGSFGASLAFGDFDGDGKRHLVIGAPNWDVVAAGSDDGALFFVPITSTTVDLAGHKGLAIGDGGRYGWAVEVGNFNGDGFDDLAVGVPFSKFLTGVADAGVTVVMRGAATGLDSLNAVYVTRDTPNVLGTPNSGANFGTALASGDFDADGRTDLAIGVPFDSIGSASMCGGVNVLRGSTTELVTGTNSQWWFGAPIGVAQSFQLMGLRMK